MTVAVVQLDGGTTTGGYTASLVRMISYTMTQHPGVVGGFNRWTGGPNIARARTRLVEWFLQTDIEWLLQIDSDMTFPPDTLMALLDRADSNERPIVAGHCYAMFPDRGPMATMWIENNDGGLVMFESYPEGLVEVAATGAACLLVHRSVFEALREHQPGHEQPWFEEMYYQSKPIGEDLTFCLRARGLGFRVFVDTTLDVGHQKMVTVDKEFYRDWRYARRLVVTGDDLGLLSAAKNVCNRLGLPCTLEKVYTEEGFQGWRDRWVEFTRFDRSGTFLEALTIEEVRKILQLARFQGMLSDSDIQQALEKEEFWQSQPRATTG